MDPNDTNWEVNPPENHPEIGEPAPSASVIGSTGKRVTDKAANRPFLVHKKWKEEQAAKERAKEERRKRREEKIKKGEPILPEDEDEKEPSVALGFIKFLAVVFAIFFLSSWFFTGTWLWGYQGKWSNWRSYIPSKQTYYSEMQLARFDGSNPDLPVLLAIDGDVYDVSAGKRSYGPGGSYHFMAGRDAARAFTTGCFKEHLTHDIRGLSDKELKSLDHWKKFFADHKTYFKVGRVYHKPIHPSTPIPPMCDKGKKQPAGPKLRDEVEAEERAKPKEHPKKEL